jgi:para-aminobenzoate synthetase component 1
MLPAPLLTPLTYTPDSALWFVLLRHLPHAIWLDSGHPGSQYGRFDILTAAPDTLLETRGAMTRISPRNGQASESTADPFQLLNQCLLTSSASDHRVPFVGGALGYFGYDLGRRLEKLPSIAISDLGLPDMCVGIYPWAIIQDHQLKQAWLVQNKGINKAYNFLEIEQI